MPTVRSHHKSQRVAAQHLVGIGGEQRELLNCRAGRQESPGEGAIGPGIEVAHASGRAHMGEALNGDSHEEEVCIGFEYGIHG